MARSSTYWCSAGVTAGGAAVDAQATQKADLLRKRLEYPALKRAVREQQSLFNANVALIEDKASGTQLIQELIADGCHGVTRYKPEGDKIMRLHAQTSIIENGFVHLPDAAPWLPEYLHEMTVFPKGKHDDQVDSTAQFLDWFKTPMPHWGIYEYTGRMAEKLKHPEQWEQFYVRLKAPAGIRSVQTFSGRHLNIGSDGTVEMSAEDAKYLIPYGWIKLAEWSCDGVA
jgi:predicted phage terminase large subunit-like protein